MYITILSNEQHHRDTNCHYLTRLLSVLRFAKENPTEGGIKHHILPKCKSWFPEYICAPGNIAVVSSRLHFLIHHLMSKAFPKDAAMYTAYWNMTHLNKDVRLTSKQYASIRKLHSENMRGSKNYFHDVHYTGESNHFFGKTHSDEFKQRQRERLLGKTYEERYGEDKATEIKKIQSEQNRGERNPFYGKHHSEETFARRRQTIAAKSDEEKELTRNKRRNNALNAGKTQCPHCGKEMDNRNYARYHGNKCKFKI